MIRRLRSRVVVVLSVALAACAAAMSLAVFASPASAAPARWNEAWYLDDAGNHVGTRYVNCSPPYIVNEGTVTSRSVIVASGPC